MTEVWKAIPGYEGRYEVSDMGRVRSLPHYVRLVAQGKETRRLSPGRILKPGKQMQSGHVSVSLGRHNSRLVHQLVLEAFVGPRPAAPKGSLIDVLHLNSNPADNRLVNLRYGTRSENIRQDWREGTRRLSEEQARALREGRRRYKLTEEHKQAMRRGWEKYHMTEEHKRALIDGRWGKGAYKGEKK